jgi:integrase/recombinase XerD
LMTGPLAPFAHAYELELKARRYTPLTRVSQLRQVRRLSGWMEERGLAVAELCGARVDEFLAFQRAGGRHRCQWSRPGLLCLLDVLRELGVLASRGAAAGGFADGGADGFLRAHLLTERALAVGYYARIRRSRPPVPGRIVLRR